MNIKKKYKTPALSVLVIEPFVPLCTSNFEVGGSEDGGNIFGKELNDDYAGALDRCVNDWPANVWN